MTEKRNTVELLSEIGKDASFSLIEAQRMAHVGNWVADLSRNLLFASEECCRIFGLLQKDPPCSCDAFFSLTHPDDMKRVRAATESIPDSCLSHRIEYRIIRPDNIEKVVIVNEEALTDDSGRPAYIVGVVQDITCRREAEADRLAIERKFQQSQKLESLGTLAGGIAHDFNNILMVILGNLDLALKDIPHDSKPHARVEQAIKAGRMASDLTAKMLAYAGKGAFILKELDLNTVVHSNSSLFRSFVSHNITLDIVPAADLPLIYADAGQILQVIMNLLINASEAIGQQRGAIKISTGVEQCDQQTLKLSMLEDKPHAGPFVWLEISDTGCGIDKETRQRMFEPFFSTKFMGRGLGMPSALGIIRAHSGAILLESEPGKGSAFRVLFPVKKNEWEVFSKKIRSAEKPVINKTDAMILIVDDEDPVRELCIAFVKNSGFNTLDTADPVEALDIFRENSGAISLIILDMQMPKMDGIQAFYEFRKIRSDVRVLFCSGFDEEKVLSLFPGDRPEGFIQKPFMRHELTIKLNQIMKQGMANS